MVVGLLELSTARLGRPEVGYVTQMIAALKSLQSAEVAFAAVCGGGAYASSLKQLDDLSLLGNVATAFNGLAIELQSLEGNLGKDDCRGLPTTRAFYATATGSRRSHGPSFALTSNGLIWESATAVPPRPPFGAPAWSLK
jgi:hypothetical protein